MKKFINLFSIILGFVIINYGIKNLSEASNKAVYIGLVEIVLGLALFYHPIKSLFKKL